MGAPGLDGQERKKQILRYAALTRFRAFMSGSGVNHAQFLSGSGVDATPAEARWVERQIERLGEILTPAEYDKVRMWADGPGDPSVLDPHWAAILGRARRRP